MQIDVKQFILRSNFVEETYQLVFKSDKPVLIELALILCRYTTTKLGKVVENVLKQNNTLDLEEMYFEVLSCI